MNTKLGIALMLLTTVIFALQDGISRHLAGEYNVWMVVMIRYWFFAAFVIAISARKPGGLRRVAKTNKPVLQITRGFILAAEISVMVTAFTLLGLVESHAIFTSYPLLVAALSGPILGEKVGWRRWAAIVIGFCGVLIILRPGSGVFAIEALVPFAAALLFALYNLLTRAAAAHDSSATSFFWTGIVGAVVMTLTGIWHWEPMIASDWVWMVILCITGASGHYTLIKTYEYAEASSVQPFAFAQLVWASALGIIVFQETLEAAIVIGALIVIAAGLFTLWRAKVNDA